MRNDTTNPTTGQDPNDLAYVLGHMASNDYIDEDLARRVLAVVADNHRKEQIALDLYFDRGWYEELGTPSDTDVITAFHTIKTEIAQAKAESDPAPVDLDVWGWINDL